MSEVSSSLSKNRANYLFFIGIFVLLVIFIAFSPIIDKYIASKAYNAVTKIFYGESHYWCKLIYNLIPIITAILIISCVFILVFIKRVGEFGHLKRTALIVLLSLCIGPGILVNVVFKDNWGRARPYQVLRDNKPFTPVWQPNFKEHKNNSFPSGHAAIGFFLGVPFLAINRRRIGLIVGVVGGSIVGLVRVLQGGHYLSDVVLCAFIVWLSAELVVYLVNMVLNKEGKYR